MFRIVNTTSRSEWGSKTHAPKVSCLPTKSSERYTDPSTFRDVHVYDRKSEEISLPCYTPEVTKECLARLKSLLKDQRALAMVDIIQERDGYDPLNGVNSRDILVWICLNYISDDIFSLLEEQLIDNYALGTCLQGSSHRLRQIYYAAKELS